MNTRLLLTVFFLLVFGKQDVLSQYGVTHEVGIITGPVAFYSDFGERGDYETNKNNVGFGIGIVHYLNFALRSSKYFDEHFKIRNELVFHKTNFHHYGRWVKLEKTSVMANQLRAMSGSTTAIEIGSQLEYYPLSIYDFENNGFKITPFFGLGAHLVYYDPEVKSSLGPLNLIPSTPDKYYNSFKQRPGFTVAFVGSVGFRYKLTPMSDLMLDSRWQFYLSDDVDGLNPSFEKNGTTEVPENKSNDWVYWLNIGYIYYLN